MAKSLIVNKLGGRKFSIYVPADDTTASTFAETFLDGVSDICQLQSEAGNETEAQVKDVLVKFKDNTNDLTAFLGFYVKSTKSDVDVINTLVGKSIDGVKGEVVTVLRMQTINPQGSQNNNNNQEG